MWHKYIKTHISSPLSKPKVQHPLSYWGIWVGKLMQKQMHGCSSFTVLFYLALHRLSKVHNVWITETKEATKWIEPRWSHTNRWNDHDLFNTGGVRCSNCGPAPQKQCQGKSINSPTAEEKNQRLKPVSFMCNFNVDPLIQFKGKPCSAGFVSGEKYVFHVDPWFSAKLHKT